MLRVRDERLMAWLVEVAEATFEAASQVRVRAVATVRTWRAASIAATSSVRPDRQHSVGDGRRGFADREPRMAGRSISTVSSPSLWQPRRRGLPTNPEPKTATSTGNDSMVKSGTPDRPTRVFLVASRFSREPTPLE
jgi:hypothetical protein